MLSAVASKQEANKLFQVVFQQCALLTLLHRIIYLPFRPSASVGGWGGRNTANIRVTLNHKVISVTGISNIL